MKKLQVFSLVVLGSVLALSACTKNSLLYGGLGGAGGRGAHLGFHKDKFKLGPHRGLLGVRQYFFPCDSIVLPQQYQTAAAAQAQYLKGHSGSAVQLQGFADTAGSPEYNIAIAQQRSQSVAQYMIQQGAKASQINVMSYGAETNGPYTGSSTAANCRVDVVYTKD